MKTSNAGNDRKTGDSGSDENIKRDSRLIYIIPSVLSLALSLTVLLFVFGNAVVDMNNTCYYIYINQPENNGIQMTDEECMEIISRIMDSHDISGFTVQKNLVGGYRDKNGKIVLSESYQIILMDVSKSEVLSLTKEIKKEFDQELILVEEVIMTSYYVSDTKQEYSLRDIYI